MRPPKQFEECPNPECCKEVPVSVVARSAEGAVERHYYLCEHCNQLFTTEESRQYDATEFWSVWQHTGRMPKQPTHVNQRKIP